jgi:hypothetical protein
MQREYMHVLFVYQFKNVLVCHDTQALNVVFLTGLDIVYLLEKKFELTQSQKH